MGLLHRGGAPVDRALLQALNHFLAYCGPDAQEVWSEGSVGFGHAMLRATRESFIEHQPASLDEQFWITADARLDCRAELEAKLELTEREHRRPALDSELILQAYAAWGEGCVHRLRGDFAFAIWDARRKTLLCARDHLGIKPFYYAQLGDLFLFSNVLNCLRLHPGVSDELNDAAIADFLLFGLNCDAATTTFRDICRLPPAHYLVVSPKGLQIERYWSVPTDERIRYRQANDYVEHFQLLLHAAVADRLRTDRTGIFLSGGLDSSAVAVTARELASSSAGSPDLRAYTIIYESLIPDQTGARAREVAEFLGIPIRFLAVDNLQLFERWDDPELSWPEPVDDPFLAGLFDQFRMVAEDCRVALLGEGADNLMHFQMWPYARDLLQNREWRRLAVEVPRYLWLRRSIWPGIRRRVKKLFSKNPKVPAVPQWIAPDFARHTNVEARWNVLRDLLSTKTHPTLPKAHASLALPQWQRLFECQNPGITHFPVEVRYPFLDLRIVDYLLALPPFPWSFRKKLLREAMAGHLPEGVRLRSKTPLEGEPLVERLQGPATEWMSKVQWAPEIDQYVDRTALTPLEGERDSERARLNVRPLCLNSWLVSQKCNQLSSDSGSRAQP